MCAPGVLKQEHDQGDTPLPLRTRQPTPSRHAWTGRGLALATVSHLKLSAARASYCRRPDPAEARRRSARREPCGHHSIVIETTSNDRPARADINSKGYPGTTSNQVARRCDDGPPASSDGGSTKRRWLRDQGRCLLNAHIGIVVSSNPVPSGPKHQKIEASSTLRQTCRRQSRSACFTHPTAPPQALYRATTWERLAHCAGSSRGGARPPLIGREWPR
jgi:hypothetical protein